MNLLIPKFRDLNKEDLAKTNPALIVFYEFLNMCVTYFEVDYKLEPARKELKDKGDNLRANEIELEEMKTVLESMQKKIEVLKESMKEKDDDLSIQEQTMDLHKNRLERSSKLTEGLKNDKGTWMSLAKDYEERKRSVEGDLLICSGMLS